jgi:hypothetical protein
VLSGLKLGYFSAFICSEFQAPVLILTLHRKSVTVQDQVENMRSLAFRHKQPSHLAVQYILFVGFSLALDSKHTQIGSEQVSKAIGYNTIVGSYLIKVLTVYHGSLVFSSSS